MAATDCANCGRAIDGAEQKFCPACGQPTPAPRIDMTFIRQQLQRDVFSVDRGLVYTLRNLLLRPGHMLREYLDGRRAPYVKPLVLLMLTTALLLFASHLFGSGPMPSNPAQAANAGQREMHAAVASWFNSNFALVTLVLLPIEAAAFKLAFRRFREVNYAQWLVILAYLTAITSLLWTIVLLLRPWLDMGRLTLALMFAYMVFGLLQFFPGHPRWSILLRTFVGMAMYLVGYAVFLQLVTFALYGLIASGLMSVPG